MTTDEALGRGHLPDSDVDAFTRDMEPVQADEYQSSYGEPLARTLDLATWQAGTDLAHVYERLQVEIADAVAREIGMEEHIRRVVFPRLSERPDAPKEAGVYQATVEQISFTHRHVLFNGDIEACDGTSVIHDTLPVTIIQLGVCLVSYRGDQGTWSHRLFRRDLRSGGVDPVEEALDMLEHRARRAGFGASSRKDQLTDLGRRGLMTYAERAVLLERSDARWRMGHGSPAPYELITGSGMPELADASLDLLSRLICEHRRFVFVPSGAAQRHLLTIGNALRPLEYAVIETLEGQLERVARGGYRGEEWGPLGRRVTTFAHDVGSQVLVGVYRASALSPAQLFYAHPEHVHEAALIAMADSALQEHRGFPMLIDLADTLCSSVFDTASFLGSIGAGYAQAGAPTRFFNERQNRPR